MADTRFDVHYNKDGSQTIVCVRSERDGKPWVQAVRTYTPKELRKMGVKVRG